MTTEAQKKAAANYYYKNKDAISDKRREYFRIYNAKRPKKELSEEERQTRIEYMRNYRASRKQENKL
jgi:hypothetical protein